MMREEREAIDALDRQLDALVHGTPYQPATGDEVALAATAAEIQHQFLGDPAATPSPDFLQRLEHQLMEHAELAQPIGTGQPTWVSRLLTGAFFPPLTRQDRRRTASRRRNWGHWGQLTAAAIVLLTIVAGFGAFQLRPQHPASRHVPGYGMTLGATPTTGESGCTAVSKPDRGTASAGTSRSSHLPESANGTAPAGISQSSSLTISGAGGATTASGVMSQFAVDPNQGQPADAATVDAIKKAVEHFGNCIAGDVARSASGQNASTQQDQGSPAATSSAAREVSNVRNLADGRVGAVVTTKTPNSPTSELYVIFRQVGGSWMLDEVVPLASSQATGESGAVSSGTPAP